MVNAVGASLQRRPASPPRPLSPLLGGDEYEAGIDVSIPVVDAPPVARAPDGPVRRIRHSLALHNPLNEGLFKVFTTEGVPGTY